MTISKLATETWPLGKTPAGANRYYKRAGKPQGFIVHHAAITSDSSLKAQYVSKSRELSSNYAMRQNGDVVAILHEEYRPFTSSSAKADNWGITIEIANETAGPEWRISARAFDQLARLIADCATRWDFPINRQTVIGHREVRGKFGQGIATACPGPWLWARMDELVVLARHYQAEASKPAAPARSAAQIEEEELMGAKDDIIDRIEAMEERIRRESRPRLYERESTGELLLVRYETGFQRGPWPNENAMRAALPVDAEHLVSTQEYERRLKVSDEDWAQLLDRA